MRKPKKRGLELAPEHLMEMLFIFVIVFFGFLGYISVVNADTLLERESIKEDLGMYVRTIAHTEGDSLLDYPRKTGNFSLIIYNDKIEVYDKIPEAGKTTFDKSVFTLNVPEGINVKYKKLVNPKKISICKKADDITIDTKDDLECNI